MYPKNLRKTSVIAVVTLAALLIGGTATVALAATTPYSNDANTVLLDHFDGATSASVLAYSETGEACGSQKPSATPNSVYVTGSSGLSQALNLSPPAGQPTGSATYLQYPGGQLLSQPNGTIEFWIYLTTYGTGVSLVDQGPYYGSCAGWTFGMGVNATGQLSAGAWDAFNMNSGATTVPLNAWTHVAASWGGAGAKLYINGVQVGSDANTGMPASGYAGSVLIRAGTHTGAGSQIDELRISNVQRTSFSASGIAGTGTHNASGTYTWNAGTGTLAFTITASDFICDGATLGTETHAGVTVTATTMTWPGEMIWTRSSGTAGDIVGIWAATDSGTGNSYTLAFNGDDTISLIGVILQCGGGDEDRNPSANSQHWANGYYVQLDYHDSPKTATAVTVTGPGITGAETLTYNTNYGSWNSWTSPSNQVFLGSALPTGLPFTYTFSITDTSTWTADSTVTCFQELFATNLSPAGSVTGVSSFSWTGIGDAGARYGVELNDSNWNRIWSQYDITGTSIPYTGPALTPGVTYNYLVSIQTSNACSTGASFAQSSFTYSGTGGGTISFSGMVRTPSLSQPNESLPVAGAVVQAREVVFPLSGGAAYGETSTNDQSIFTLSGIPAAPSVFRLIIPTLSGTGYIPVLSQFFSSAVDIQALLPYILFTPEQYNAFGNASNTGMIRGRVALKDNPASFLAGATIVARAWTPGDPPALGDFYPVTYTSGTATQADGIYMVKNVPTGTIVQLVAMLANHTFEFNPAPIVPVASGFVSEASFFATAGQQSPFNVYSYHQETSYFINMFVDDPSHAFTGVTVNGPGLEGEVSLEYVATRGRWEIASSIGLGSTLPTGSRTYNFTATASSTPLTGSKTVNVYVEGFAADLQPTGNITAPPVFSWTGIAGGTGYAVVLNDLTAGTGVWNSPNLAGGQTSVVYSGPVLVEGHTYEYTVISSINTDGNSNSSFARAQFTYTGGSTISFSGMLKDTSDNPIGGVTVEQVGNPTVSTTSNTDGTFTLTGLPSGTPFSVKMTGGAAYVPSYSAMIQSTTDMISPRPFNLFTPAELSGWGVATGTGAIRGRVLNDANLGAGYVSGATVTYTSLQNRIYRVKSEDVYGNLVDGATTAKGRYYILDVVEGDTVTVSATHPNYGSFHSAPFQTYANAVTQGIVSGPAVSGRAGIGGHILNSATPATGIKSATVEQVGATSPINATTSNPDGAFYLSVPTATVFHLKFSKPQATTPALAPTYSADMSFLGDAPAMGDYNLFPTTKLTDTVASGGWGVTPGKGIIRGRVRDQVSRTAYIGGATVTAQSALHPETPYTVCYDDACSLTATDSATGRFIVKNVDGGDTVTVTALGEGWSFNPRTFHTYADSLHQGSVVGRTTNNLLQNGSFSGNLNGWIVNPALRTETAPWPLLGDGSGVTLHPDMHYGFNGTILYQNLNLTNVAGKTLSLSIKLTNLYGYTAGNTVSVWLTYVDGVGNLVRTKVLSPANSSITSGTIVTGSFAVPAGAQKIVKLELVKGDYGSFNADDVVLWADGITSGPTPSIAGLSAPSGAYGATLTINGANFGTTQGSVKIGGMAAAVASWTDTAITVSVASPVRSGSVVVIAGGVESNPSQPFQVTSPYFTVDLLNQGIKVIKGQKGEYLLKTTFFNSFTMTAGIGLQLQGGDAAILSGKTTFIPVPIRGQGGVVLKIDTADLAAGTYTADIAALNGSETVPVGTLNLQVVTVSDIKFYEWVSQPSPNPSIRVDLTSAKTLTTQGQFYIYQEVVGSDGQIFTGETDVVLSEVPAASPILGIFNRFWGYDLYAQNNGTTQLRATAPDGTVRTLGITVNFPLTSWVSAIGLSTPAGAPSIYPLYNNRTAPINWFAQGTTRLSWIGYDTSGMMNFGIDFLDKLNRSQDGLSATSTFNLQNTPTDIGTAILYAQTDGGAKAVIPLTTVNAPGTGLLSFYLKSLDPQAFAEMFQVSFYGTDNQLKFSRDVFAMHVGAKPVLVGNIPPGTYKILFAPGNTSVKPQWWPNAADISGSEPLVFAADATVDNIYFFAQPQPMGAMITLPTPPIRDFTSTQAGTGSLAVTASDPDLFWTAVSSAPWITITSGVSGIGSGTVNYTVAANPYGASRTGTITVAGQAFTITQAGTGIIPPYVGVWGVQQLIHFDPGYDQVGDISVPWYAEVARTTLHEDGTGIMVIKKNDHNGELIEQTKPFTYTMASNADGSLAMSITMDGQTMTQRLVVSDGGRMAIMDGTAQEGQQKLMVLYRIDPVKSYSNADLNGEYYNVGFERNASGAADPPEDIGRFMAFSGIYTFNGAGTYNYYGKANSVKSDGSNLIWDDSGKTGQSYAVAANGTMTAGGGAFQGWLTGNGLALGGGGAFLNGVNTQMGYFFLKKGDRPYSTADLAGKWAIVSFGQDSKTTVPASEGFSSSIGTMICDTLGQCSVKLRDRWSGSAATTIATDNLNFSVAADGSFGTAFGGQSPAYAGAIGNNGNTILLNPSFKYAAAADPYHREILIGVRASNVGDLAGGTAYLKGDINGDGRVDMADAVLALKVVTGMNPAGIRTDYATSGADVNNDGTVGRAELIYILQYLGGLRP